MKSATEFALDMESKLAKVGCEAADLTSKATNAAQDGITAAKKTVRKGWRAGEDFIDEATIAVKRHPLKSIGIAFGVAFAVGTLTGWLVRRR